MSVSAHNEKTIDKDKLKPGYVLNEEIPFIPGLRRGYVLSQSVIDEIKKSDKIDKVNVLIQGKDDINIGGEDFNNDADTRKPEITVPQIKTEELLGSLFNPRHADKVKEVVELKKKIIRGDDYEDRVLMYKTSNLEKFTGAMRSVQVYLRKEAEQLIEHHAQTAADFEGISALPGISVTGELVNKLNAYEKNVAKFLEAALLEKKIYSACVESIVMDVIHDVGYKLQIALFSAVSRSYFYFDFLTSHSLQVLLVALITAIEMTAIINEKVKNFTEADINTFLAISKKTYTIEELVNLGIAALLHDISLKKQIPDLKHSTELDIHQESMIDLHPSNSFHICKELNIDFDVQRAVYQHHERFDGSGYPSGLLPRFFTKYTSVIMFAEHYVEETTKNPFIRDPLHPRQSLVNILSNHRHRFDGDVVYAFVRAASLFPIGSWVQLNNGDIGVVVGFEETKMAKPRVKVFLDKSMKRIEAFEIDLATEEVSISKPVNGFSVTNAYPELAKLMFQA